MFPKRPLKLVDTTRRDASSRELFLVEGDSAAAAVAAIRHAPSQAVLPMQGKPMNAWKATAPKVQGYALFQELSKALGVPMVDALQKQGALFEELGPGLVEQAAVGATHAKPIHQPADEQVDAVAAQALSRLRYERLLLLFDPDADGIHCGALMLMFLHRWMRPLLASGRVEMIRAPLFLISCKPDATGALQTGYAYSMDHCRATCDALRQRGAVEVVAHHYRGLGSIDADVLGPTCLIPASRKTQVMGVADAEAALAVFGSAAPAFQGDSGPSTAGPVAHIKPANDPD